MTEEQKALLAAYKEEKDERLARNLELAVKGVKFQDIEQAYVGADVTIGSGTYIGACVTLEGRTEIGENCVIGQNSRLVDAVIADGVDVQSSVILESSVGEGTKVGPFAYIRPGSHIGKNCKVGDFVEIKNSEFGDGSKAAHLTYVGDSTVGKRVNLGCGVVFVNYDGKNKAGSVIGDDAFIGCNVNLVAPVKVGEKAYIGAGSTVTEDVPAGALVVGRSRQQHYEGWVARSGLLDK